MSSTDEEYNPYAHRKRKNSITNMEALTHLIKGILNTGILALPEAFLYSGPVTGAICFLIITILINYSLHIMFRNRFILCKMYKIPEISYAQALKSSLLIGPVCLKRFANIAPYLLNTCTIICQLGNCCIINIFIVTSIKEIVDHNGDSKEFYFGVEVYIILLLIPLLAITYVRDLKALTPFSNIANLMTIAGLAIIYYYTFEDIESVSDSKYFTSMRSFALYIGTAMYSFLTVGVIVSIEANMKTPENWGGYFGVLNQGMFFVFILNVFTGIIGCLKYGEKIKTSITLNLPIGEPLAWIARILLAIALYFSYSLHCFPIRDILWEQYSEKYMLNSQHKLFWEYTLRTDLVLITFLLSVILPNCGLIMSLIGSFCLSMLGTIFPSIIDICLHWPDNYGRMKWILYKNIAIICFGIMGISFGIYTCVYEIIVDF